MMISAATPCLPQDHPTAMLFIDESGAISQDRFFAVGCLKLPEPHKILRQLQRLRDQRQFYGELHFTKVTLGSLPFYKDVVQLLFSSDEKFSCFVADRHVADPVARFGTGFAAYEKLAAQLISASIRPGEIATVLADNYSTPPQVLFEEAVKKQVNRRLSRLAVTAVCRLDSKSADPLQLVDLLTSAVAHDFRTVAGIGRATNPKGQLAAFVRSEFGVGSFLNGHHDARLNVKVYEHRRWSARQVILSATP